MSASLAPPALPPVHRALVFTSTSQPLELRNLPTPTPSPGSAIIRVSAASVVSYAREIYVTGERQFPYPKPYVPAGGAAVGRIVALGNDATTLRVGDLVLTELFLRARDDPTARALQGLHQGGPDGSPNVHLVQDEDGYRHGSWAEYEKVPLENCHRLPERVGSKDVTPAQWLRLFQMLVPFGGLTTDGGVDLRPGETIVIAPATGGFSGSAVQLALSMGARVVALGRSTEGLRRLEDGLREFVDLGRLRTVQMTESMEPEDLARAIGPVDCYLDLSPPAASGSRHFKACILALAVRGRACLMGGVEGDVALPHSAIYTKDLRITGRWMYERKAVGDLIKMVETGVLNLDKGESRSFKLEDWDSALRYAAEHGRWGQYTLFEP
ncbi:chaperonin 10-like protein [Trametes punicea]|nr:chaperonin 10-like protein [Trametes punicea]